MNTTSRSYESWHGQVNSDHSHRVAACAELAAYPIPDDVVRTAKDYDAVRRKMSDIRTQLVDEVIVKLRGALEQMVSSEAVNDLYDGLDSHSLCDIASSGGIKNLISLSLPNAECAQKVIHARRDFEIESSKWQESKEFQTFRDLVVTAAQGVDRMVTGDSRLIPIGKIIFRFATETDKTPSKLEGVITALVRESVNRDFLD